MSVVQSLKLYQENQDAVSNSSELRILWKSTQSGDSRNLNTRTAKYWVSINGGAEEEYSVSYTLPKSKTQTILDVIIIVPHDDTGKCEVSVRTWMDTRISAGVVELSKDITLTPILRAHTITAQDAFIDGVLTVSVARKSADYYQSIHYQFGELSGYMASSGGTAVFEERSKADKYLFEIPYDWDAQIPNAKSGICTLTCKTYLGAEKIGETSIKVNIKTDRGSFAPQILSAQVEDVNPVSLALTGNKSRLIRGVSTARATMTALARRCATIKSCEINGIKTEALEVENVSDGGFVFQVLDSRGWETSAAQSLSIIPYFRPTATVDLDWADIVNHILRVTVSGNFYSKSFGKLQNTLSTNLRVDGGAWQAMDQTRKLNEDPYIAKLDLSLDYQIKHELELEIKDRINTLTLTVPIPKAIPVTMEGENFFRINVPLSLFGGVEPMAAIPAGGDANDCTADGLYKVTSDSNAKTIANLPSTYAGLLQTFNALGETRTEGNYLYKTQVYISRVASEPIKWRSMGTGDTGTWTFGAWFER